MVREGVNVIKGIVTEITEITNIKGENSYDFVSVDLGTARDPAAEILSGGASIAGKSLTVFTLDGSCSLIFNASANPEISLTALTYPSMLTFNIEYTKIFVKNTAQTGKTLKLFVGKKV